MMNKRQITDFTFTTSAGIGNKAMLAALKNQQTGLTPCRFQGLEDFAAFCGEIAQISEVTLPAHLQEFTCRNNQLAELALNQDNFLDSIEQLKLRFPSHRIGVFMGTSTSGMQQTEHAYTEGLPKQHLPDWFNYQHTQDLYSLADFICQRLEITGISQVISTACSSSSKVFASAHRAIEAGLCDCAIVGGIDTLCLTTLFGFNSLQLVDSDICKPCDANRHGLSLGEGAGFAIIEKPTGESPYYLTGFGETSDAYHMSSPHPEGLGAQQAMTQALAMAKLDAEDIDYINLHGTGTPTNDKAECFAVNKLFESTPASSTKGWTGHTLGAAGIVEAAISLLSLKENWLPNTLNLQEQDPDIHANILHKPLSHPIKRVLSNSFGFGGSNASLIFEMIEGKV